MLVFPPVSWMIRWRHILSRSAFFVTVRAGTAYRKIWRLVNNFFCSHNKVHCSEIPIVLSNPLYHYFFIKLWHILILWLAKMPNGGMPVFTLIATGWRYRKIFSYKKSTAVTQWPSISWHLQSTLASRTPPSTQYAASVIKRLSVRLSVPSINSSGGGQQVCCWGRAQIGLSIDSCCVNTSSTVRLSQPKILV